MDSDIRDRSNQLFKQYTQSARKNTSRSFITYNTTNKDNVKIDIVDGNNYFDVVDGNNNLDVVNGNNNKISS